MEISSLDRSHPVTKPNMCLQVHIEQPGVVYQHVPSIIIYLVFYQVPSFSKIQGKESQIFKKVANIIEPFYSASKYIADYFELWYPDEHKSSRIALASKLKYAYDS